MQRTWKKRTLAGAAALAVVTFAGHPLAQTRPAAPAGGGQAAAAPRGPAKPAQHSQKVRRMLIENAMIIYGNGKPPYGPMDILIENGLIASITASGGREKPANIDAVIDATDKYVMPGIVNTHMHWHEERYPGIPQPVQYEMNLYLATGSTTAREVGGNDERTKKWRADSNAGTLMSPRILMWNRPSLGDRTPAGIRAGVRKAKADGYDGLKIGGLDRDQLEALIDEAKKVNLCTTTHIGVEETTARDYVDLGVCSIEHFYGIGDAALDGIQNFPPEHNSNNEIHRFGRAGELYIQENFNKEKLSKLLDDMVAKKVGWSPTMSTYEASRDLIKAQNLPWYKDYLHPSLEEYYRPSLMRHGTYWLGWTNTQEVRWRKDYRVWMDALKEFGVKGGLISVGDDAGYLYGSLYGFGMVRELELQEEAGFHPLEVLAHATWNGAQMVGMGDKLGKVRQGYIADLLVVNGNPVENLRLLNPYGVDQMTYDGKPINSYAPVFPSDTKVKVAHGGGIEWTIKDGIPYHVPTIMKQTKEMVEKARADLQKKGMPTTTSASPDLDVP